MGHTFEEDLEKELRDPEFARGFGSSRAKSSFALTLANARLKAGLTQKELAEKAGVSQAYVAKLEGGEANPTLERIGSLLAVLGLSLVTDTTTLSPHAETPNTVVKWTPDFMKLQPKEPSRSYSKVNEGKRKYKGTSP